jgi:hypothetical protein
LLGRELLREHDGRAHPADLQEPGGEPEDVEERQRQQHPVDRGDRRGPQRGGLRAVGQQRAVRQQDAARHPRGARGVDEQGDVLAAAHTRPARRPGREVGRPDDGGVHGRGAPSGGVVAVGRDHELRVTVREHDLELPLDRDGPVRHHDGARAERPEHGDAERRTARQPHDDPVARTDARARNAVGLGRHRLVELRPRHRVRAGHVDDSGLIGHPSGVRHDEVGDVRSVHGSPGFCGGSADARQSSTDRCPSGPS